MLLANKQIGAFAHYSVALRVLSFVPIAGQCQLCDYETGSIKQAIYSWFNLVYRCINGENPSIMELTQEEDDKCLQGPPCCGNS